MKKMIGILFLSFVSVPKATALPAPNIMVVDNFDDKRLMNKLGGNIGTWKRDPKDDSQWYELSFDDRNFIGKSGASLRIDYSIASHLTTYVAQEAAVTSPEVGFHAPGFGGIYFQLKNQDISGFKYLILSIKGDRRIGYTRKFKLEMKDKSRNAAAFVDGITPSWKRFYIPLWKFDPAINLKQVQDLVIVFDSSVTLPKGALYLDEIYFATDKISIEDYNVYQELLKAQEPIKIPVTPAPKVVAPPTPEQIVEMEKKELLEMAEAASLDVKKEEDNVVVTTHINFETAQDTIQDSEIEKLSGISELITKYPRFFVEIHGHTDSVGKPSYNLHLSQRRAHAVKDFFSQLDEIASNRLIPYGWGLSKPIDSNATAEGRAQNRRVEFVFTSTAVAPVYRNELPQKIDGALLDIPKFETFQIDKSNLELGVATDDKDISGKFYLQWDDQYLYFAGRIHDNEVVCLKKDRNIFMSDCVELYLDPAGDGLAWSNPEDFQIGFTPSGTDSAPQMWAWFQNRRPSPQEVKYAARLEKDGYTLEAAIAWEYLGPELAQKIREAKGKFAGGEEIPLKLSVALHDLDQKDETKEAKLNFRFKKEEGKRDRFLLGSLKLLAP